jgi:hypothetical protein
MANLLKWLSTPPEIFRMWERLRKADTRREGADSSPRGSAHWSFGRVSGPSRRQDCRAERLRALPKAFSPRLTGVSPPRGRVPAEAACEILHKALPRKHSCRRDWGQPAPPWLGSLITARVLRAAISRSRSPNRNACWRNRNTPADTHRISIRALDGMEEGGPVDPPQSLVRATQPLRRSYRVPGRPDLVMLARIPAGP